MSSNFPYNSHFEGKTQAIPRGEFSFTNIEAKETNSSTNKKKLGLSNHNENQEKFSEFWAIYESLIHENDELPTIDKIMLLK